MSRLEELLKELCPKGVEYKPLGNLCRVFNGYAFKSEFFNTDGVGLPLIRIRDVNTGYSDTYFSGDYDEKWIVENGDILIGMDGDFRASRWTRGRALLNQRVCRLQDFSAELLPSFLFYEVQDELDRIHSSITGSTVKHLSSRALEGSHIPVPPLEVQREIVRILDQFTQLEAELEAELEARWRQYQHYRQHVMTFPDSTPRIPLGRLVKIRTGSAVSKQAIQQNPGQFPVINSGRQPLGFIAEFNTEDDPIGITSRGAGVGSVTYCEGRYFRGNLNYSVTIREPGELTTRFLYHSLQFLQPQIQALCSFQGIPALNKVNLEKLSMPLPDVSDQQRIASLLDKFDALTSDLSSGLPAEIAARRKQYEHYRDRLLTFEELSA